MAGRNDVIPTNQVVGYFLAVLLILLPLLGFRSSPDIFGSHAWRNLIAIIAIGGAVTMAAFVRDGERLFGCVVGAVSGVMIAYSWRLELQMGLFGFSMQLQAIIALACGFLPAAGFVLVFRHYKGNDSNS